MRNEELELDALWRHAVKVGAGFCCEKCGVYLFERQLQAHHIFKRFKHSVRWLKENGACLCHKCHVWAEAHQKECIEWFRSKRGEIWFYNLELESRKILDSLTDDIVLNFKLALVEVINETR